jgi:hypothetical protein
MTRPLSDEETADLLASDAGRRHLARLGANPRAGLVIDVEAGQCPDGQRPNKQIRAVGNAILNPDTGAAWTRRIWDKYINGPTARNALDECLGDRQRVLIRITPIHITAVASV